MTLNRILSAIVAAIYLAVGLLIRDRDVGGTFSFILGTLFPLPFIWFPDALGGYAVPAPIGYINRPTIGVMIAVTGWVLLVTVPLVLILSGA